MADKTKEEALQELLKLMASTPQILLKIDGHRDGMHVAAPKESHHFD